MTTHGRTEAKPTTTTTIDGGGAPLITRPWAMWHFHRMANVFLRNAGWVRPTRRPGARKGLPGAVGPRKKSG